MKDKNQKILCLKSESGSLQTEGVIASSSSLGKITKEESIVSRW